MKKAVFCENVQIYSNSKHFFYILNNFLQVTVVNITTSTIKFAYNLMIIKIYWVKFLFRNVANFTDYDKTIFR